MRLETILQSACYDEYKAKAYYQKVIETFGNIAPFSNIVQTQNHYTAIERLCQKYGVIPPNNDWGENISIGQTLEQCYRDGVEIEASNIEMYDKILPYVMQDDIRDVFYKEQAASYNNHLPAFKACVQSFSEENFHYEQEHTQSPKHHDIYNMVQGLIKGDLDTTKLTQSLSTLGSKDMMLGLAVGAGLAMAINSDTSKDIISKLFNNEEDTKDKS